MKKVLTFFVVVIMFFTFTTSAYALGNGSVSGGITPKATGFPTTVHSLPYDTGSCGPINRYTHTNYLFYPTSTKKINVSFSGSCDAVVAYDIGLKSGLNIWIPNTLTYAPYVSGNVSTSYSWSNLNKNTKYAGYLGLNQTYWDQTPAFVRGKYTAG